MQVGVIGVNFKTSDLKLHETMAKRAIALFQNDEAFLPCPIVLLSTCNRTEIYFSAENLIFAKHRLLLLLKTQSEPSLSDCFYTYFNQECFKHLCKVAAGLDSAIFMETEIVRQVKAAYANAASRFCLPHGLHYAFQKALKVAKSVRSRFVLDRGGPTLFQTLWQIASSEFSDIKEKKVLLVGYSETHRRFSSFLTQKGVVDLVFCTRQPEAVLNYKACHRNALSHWDEYDLISCASQSDEFLIRGRGRRSHLIFDLSVPRNVDPEVESETVKLFNIEQINHMIGLKKDLFALAIEASHVHLEENIARLMIQFRAKKTKTAIENNALSFGV